MLKRRRVLLAVTGGVAAYKSAYLARRLVQAGADVRVALSASAQEFIGGQTFGAITGHRAYLGLFGLEDVSPHTDLARWAEIVVVAPATAATLSRAANGLSEDLVSATLLATQSPILFAPAMHTEMWENAAPKGTSPPSNRMGTTSSGPMSVTWLGETSAWAGSLSPMRSSRW